MRLPWRKYAARTVATGAWLAQRLLRHKSVKTSFRIVSFVMIVLNLATLAYVIYGMTSGDWFFSRR